MRLKKIKLSRFEKLVYACTLSIPIGETRTYKWIAARIGVPASARAVGNALHKNPYAPFVPCHRVVASDGRLGGYSGGLRRKIALLKKEREYKIEIDRNSLS